MSVRITCLVLSYVCATLGLIDTGGDIQYRVVLDIFSGRPNPSWTISRNHPAYFLLASGIQRSLPTPIPHRLGYRGFYIESNNVFRQMAFKTIGIGSNPGLEHMLLSSCPFPLHAEIREHVHREMRGMKYNNIHHHGKKWPFEPKKCKKCKKCKHPRYDPENWNVPPTQGANNCYNYATQRMTNTYAQPGRHCGDMATVMAVPNVMEAALCDGFVYLPFFAPKIFKGFCYLALVIWPGHDYHWYRLDSNFRWSHKMGGTPVTDLDNSGNPIFDPQFANRGNYIDFAGYLGNHPSADVI